MSVLIAGDFIPDNHIRQLLESPEAGTDLSKLTNLIAESEFRIVNLECPVTTRDKTYYTTGPKFKSDPHAAEAIGLLHFNVACLANNHIKDYGEAGIRDTLSYLEEKKILSLGAGTNIDEARKELIVQDSSRKIAIINCCENEYSIAGSNSAGANPLNEMILAGEIRRLKKENDHVLVIYHGGLEHFPLPTPDMRSRCRFLVESGADAVICHHQHISCAFEEYQGRLICYGLGNFYNPSPHFSSQDWNTGMMVEISFESGRLEYRIIPVKQSGTSLNMLSGSDSKKFNDRISDLNRIVSNDMELENRFREFIHEKRYRYYSLLKGEGKLIRKLRKLNLLPTRFGKPGILNMHNLFRCETHREIVLTLMKNEAGNGMDNQ